MMTREENICQSCAHSKVCKFNDGESSEYCNQHLAISALRPVSRGQVVKVWKGCEYCKKHKIKLVRIEMDYNETPGSPERLNPTRIPKFCPICGAPMTDEAVEMVMERLEALHE